MVIRPATRTQFAIIEFDEELKDAVEQIKPGSFAEVTEFPKGLRLKVTDDEILTDEGRALLKGDVLEIQ
jgi:hypothetical protein